MITERMLKQWRAQALLASQGCISETKIPDEDKLLISTFSERILRLTQELLDNHLIRSATK